MSGQWYSAFEAVRSPRLRHVARHGLHKLAGQDGTDLLVAARGAELAEVVALSPLGQVDAEQPLDRRGHLGGRRAIANGARRRLLSAHRAADAEVVGVDHAPVHLGLFPLEADIGDPVLAAAIGTAGDVDLQMLLEARQPRFEIVHQAVRESLGLREGDLAELAARAGDGATPEGRALEAEPQGLDLAPQLGGAAPGHVQDKEVLHPRRPQIARAIAQAEGGEGPELSGLEPAPQHRDAHIGEAVLLLRVYAHVIAVEVVGWGLGHGRLELLAHSPLELCLEAPGRPAVLEKEELEPGLLAVLAEDITVAEELGDAFDHGQRLMPGDERVEARCGSVESPPPTRSEKPARPV